MARRRRRCAITEMRRLIYICTHSASYDKSCGTKDAGFPGRRSTSSASDSRRNCQDVHRATARWGMLGSWQSRDESVSSTRRKKATRTHIETNNASADCTDLIHSYCMLTRTGTHTHAGACLCLPECVYMCVCVYFRCLRQI